MNDNVFTASEVCELSAVDKIRLLKWIGEGYVKSLTDRTGKGTKHRLTRDEATAAELMNMLAEAGLNHTMAGEAARAMVTRGPEVSYKLVPTQTTTFPVPAADVYTWRARLTDTVIFTIETPQPRFPLTRARSSD